MIDLGKRKAILLLHENGMSHSEIALRLKVSRESVRTIVKEGTDTPPLNSRSDRKTVDLGLLQELYADCEGYIQRIHEKLTKEKKIKIGYSTLSRLIRESGLQDDGKSSRCYRVPDTPGAEMQHDTSNYQVKLAGVKTSLIASLLYFRYSKQRYLKFYPLFNRFTLKCFFYETLTYFGYSATLCVIDNTHVIVLYGTGKNAVFVPEMIAFGKLFGFQWLAHEVKHSDRKAGEERSFWTVETNFFPGRKFTSLEDLNEQALRWSTEIMAHRPQTKAKIIPSVAFETEKPHLQKLLAYLPEPYQILGRDTDQYGYAPYDGNSYWVPGKARPQVKIFLYRNRLEIWKNRACLAGYPLPPHGTNNKRIPEGKDAPPRSNAKSKPSVVASEEEAIRAVGPEAETYLDWLATQKELSPGQRARLIRELFRLKSQLSAELLLQTLGRARQYQITTPKVIDRMAILLVQDFLFDPNFVDIGEDFENREIYQDGKLGALPNLSVYSNDDSDSPTPDPTTKGDPGHVPSTEGKPSPNDDETQDG